MGVDPNYLHLLGADPPSTGSSSKELHPNSLKQFFRGPRCSTPVEKPTYGSLKPTTRGLVDLWTYGEMFQNQPQSGPTLTKIWSLLEENKVIQHVLAQQKMPKITGFGFGWYAVFFNIGCHFWRDIPFPKKVGWCLLLLLLLLLLHQYSLHPWVIWKKTLTKKQLPGFAQHNKINKTSLRVSKSLDLLLIFPVFFGPFPQHLFDVHAFMPSRFGHLLVPPWSMKLCPNLKQDSVSSWVGVADEV